MSISSSLRPLEAKQADRFIAVVVFPQPPFWLATDKTLIFDPPSLNLIQLFYELNIHHPEL